MLHYHIHYRLSKTTGYSFFPDRQLLLTLKNSNLQSTATEKCQTVILGGALAHFVSIPFRRSTDNARIKRIVTWYKNPAVTENCTK